jgi:cell division protein FtsQ
MAWDKQKIWTNTLRVLTVLMWLALISGVMAGLLYARNKAGETVISRIDVVIKNQDECEFADRNMILRHIHADGDEKQINGRTVSRFPIDSVEQAIMHNRWIKHAEVYTDMNGTLNIKVTQREPVLRVINLRNESYYIDRDGLKMPVSAMYTADVPVANGYIAEGYEMNDTPATYALKGLVKIATYVDKEPFWKAQIDQIFVNAENELVLVPRVGQHKIIFGTTERMEEKFDKLMLFYREAMPRTGWSKYSSIDVRYSGQVVTKKKIQ